MSEFIKFFEELDRNNVDQVGGKNASLGEMYSNLKKNGVRVPNGFATTSKSYNYFMEKAGIKKKIREALKGLDPHNVSDLYKRGEKVRNIILKAKIPQDLQNEISQAYFKLSAESGVRNLDVAVRSSATAEDLPSISETEPVIVKLNGQVIQKKMAELYNDLSDLNLEENKLEIPTLKNNQVSWGRVSSIFKHLAKSKKLYKVKTTTGREITISPNHTLLALDSDTLKMKKVSHIKDLTLGTKIPVVKTLPEVTKIKTNSFLDILDFLKTPNVFETDDKRIKIKTKAVNWKIQNSLPRYLKLDTKLAYFLGIYCAEGSTYGEGGVLITNQEKVIRKEVEKFLEINKIKCSKNINKYSLRLHCKALVQLLHETTGAPQKDKKGKGKLCQVKQVPEFIIALEDKLIGSFLRGCFDGDGHVSKKGVVSYISTSLSLISGLTRLLEKLGIEFYLNSKEKTNPKETTAYQITIPIQESKKYYQLIGFTHPEKNKRLKEALKKTSGFSIQFKNRTQINQVLSEKIRTNLEESLDYSWITAYYCPHCRSKVSQTGYYKNHRRYHCPDCAKTIYEQDIIKHPAKSYVAREENGCFSKGAVPHNKTCPSKNLSREQVQTLLIERKLDIFETISSESVIWDEVTEISPIDYSGSVYDFEVPETQNFAAGLGDVITHNSASFAGQQETFLNIKGEAQLQKAIKKCIASLFTNRAISYREDKGFDHFDIALSVGVQKMIRSDLASSGVMFSLDTESGFENVVLINSIYGLGENIVQGKVNPDEFWVFKPTNAIISRSIGPKSLKMVYSKNKANPVKDVKVNPRDQKKPSITDEQVKELAKWAILIEKHYGMPMDMEWALDGKDKLLYIVQARPETVNSVKDKNVIKRYVLKGKGEVIATGQSVGDRIGHGRANKIMSVNDIKKFKAGEVLVTSMTDPDWEPIMKIASAIVTDKGGRVCHAAIISREMGIPCIVGTENASTKIKTGNQVTVDASQGETGYIYQGELDYQIEETDIKNLKRPKTKMMMNVGSPDLAFPASFVPNDGIGLARLEFIINNHIKIHPLALLNFKKLKDTKLKKEIEEITKSFPDTKEFFIQKLTEGIACIAASVYPKDCIVRLSDFKTNEYANLIGGEAYEPKESNPMIGWRGANRYYSENFLPAFEMECEALRRVRDDMGLVNLKIMIPFCRTIEEALEVKKIMARNGLKQGKNNLEIYVMAEIPTNIILADKFAQEFDGFSIGSNDLTQLTLGIDRDSGDMLHILGASNEKNESVKILIRDLIKTAHKYKTKVGICGQAPSDFPDFNEFLVEAGIDSISLIPETVVKTTQIVNQAEAKLKKRKKKK